MNSILVGTFEAPSPYAGRRLLYQNDSLLIEGVGRVDLSAVQKLFSDPGLQWSSAAMVQWAVRYGSWAQQRVRQPAAPANRERIISRRPKYVVAFGVGVVALVVGVTLLPKAVPYLKRAGLILSTRTSGFLGDQTDDTFEAMVVTGQQVEWSDSAGNEVDPGGMVSVRTRDGRVLDLVFAQGLGQLNPGDVVRVSEEANGRLYAVEKVQGADVGAWKSKRLASIRPITKGSRDYDQIVGTIEQDEGWETEFKMGLVQGSVALVELETRGVWLAPDEVLRTVRCYILSDDGSWRPDVEWSIDAMPDPYGTLDRMTRASPELIAAFWEDAGVERE